MCCVFYTITIFKFTQWFTSLCFSYFCCITPQTYKCKITMILDAHKFCWSGILPGLWENSFAPYGITKVSHWYSADGWSGLEDPRWLLSQAGAIGEWLESWNRWLECPRVASLAWPSQGSWISLVVTIFLQRKCSKRTRQKLICFCDLLSEFILFYFCHTLLVKAALNLPRFKGGGKGSTSWWGSDLIGRTCGKGDIFWK